MLSASTLTTRRLRMARRVSMVTACRPWRGKAAATMAWNISSPDECRWRMSGKDAVQGASGESVLMLTVST